MGKDQRSAIHLGQGLPKSAKLRQELEIRRYQGQLGLGNSEEMDLLAGHRYTLLFAYSSVQSIYLFVYCVGMYTRLFQSDQSSWHPYKEKQDESNHCYTLLISSLTTNLLPFLAPAIGEGGDRIRNELIDSLRWLRTQLLDILFRIIGRIRIRIKRLSILGLLVSISTLTICQLHLNIASFSQDLD